MSRDEPETSRDIKTPAAPSSCGRKASVELLRLLALEAGDEPDAVGIAVRENCEMLRLSNTLFGANDGVAIQALNKGVRAAMAVADVVVHKIGRVPGACKADELKHVVLPVEQYAIGAADDDAEEITVLGEGPHVKEVEIDVPVGDNRAVGLECAVDFPNLLAADVAPADAAVTDASAAADAAVCAASRCRL